jgi:hypothetical protein
VSKLNVNHNYSRPEKDFDGEIAALQKQIEAMNVIIKFYGRVGK